MCSNHNNLAFKSSGISSIANNYWLVLLPNIYLKLFLYLSILALGTYTLVRFLLYDINISLHKGGSVDLNTNVSTLLAYYIHLSPIYFKVSGNTTVTKSPDVFCKDYLADPGNITSIPSGIFITDGLFLFIPKSTKANRLSVF
jgi:hypothetical protein